MRRQIDENQTRKEMIDPQLERADLSLRDYSKVREEILVDGYDAERWFVLRDYCLYHENGGALKVQQFQNHITQHKYNVDQFRFLRAVQSLFLQKHYFEIADTSASFSASLHEPPLDMFGADAVDRLFSRERVDDTIHLSQNLALN